MKATRILLFLSPLLLLVPPLIPVNDSLGMALLNSFYKGLIGRFPGNALMAFLCYTYATQLGREAWPWVTGSLAAPFLAPLILAFMPPKYDSTAYNERRRGGRAAAPARAASGPFEERFPLLSAYLAQLPPAGTATPRALLEPVQANFEFNVLVDPTGLDTLLAGAAACKMTVWTNPEESGVRVFGAGMVATPSIDRLTKWLREAAPSRKVATAVHPAEGPPKFFEYYPTPQ